MAGDVDVIETGPLFDGTMPAAIASAMTEIRQQLADVGYRAVQEALSGDLENPTGFYQSQITYKNEGDATRVTGDDVIYHWWLAGAGSRNAPVTAFAGYDHWSVALQETQGQVADVASRVIADALGTGAG